MKSSIFTNFDTGIIILLVTLVVGFLIYMILRLFEIFSSSRELKSEKEKMDIEMLKIEKELIKKAKEKKEKSEKGSLEKVPIDELIEDTSNEKDSGLQNKKEDTPIKDNGDNFSDIKNENIVQF
ncbi:hypothetical protein KKB18_00355 [bacterium]|nr:hypothetical protein [bacterium]